MIFRSAILTFIIFLSCFTAKAQHNYLKNAPYKKDSILPAFQLMQEDSSWLNTAKFLKKKPIVIIFFNTDCPHCQHEATILAPYIHKRMDVEFIWTSYTATFKEMNNFAVKYNLKNFKNTIFTKDVKYMIPNFYHLQMTPYIAVYNQKGHLIKTFNTGATPEELAQLLQ